MTSPFGLGFLEELGVYPIAVSLGRLSHEHEHGRGLNFLDLDLDKEEPLSFIGLGHAHVQA